MRLREFSISMALMSLTFITAQASPPFVFMDEVRPELEDDRDFGGARMTAPRSLEPSPLIAEDKVLGSAYSDTLSILNSSNECSDFFGGPAAAVEVFTKMMANVRKSHFSVSISMRMSGRTTNVTNNETRNEYRLFDKVSINSNGPFYRKRVSNWEPSYPRVGPYEPNTKEARALIFLHELGHSIKGPDGNWLLPDDGADAGLSRQNSNKIEDVCKDQIKSLGKAETKNHLPSQKRPDEKVAVAVEAPATQP
ncbi:MAG: hypothetical protein ACREBG_12040 [Pyrinomonadaceae bacterium]